MKKLSAVLLTVMLLCTALCAAACDVPYVDAIGEKAQTVFDDVRYDFTGEHECTPGAWETLIEAENCQKDGFACRFCTRCCAICEIKRVEADHEMGEIVSGENLTCKYCDYNFGTVPYFSLSEEEDEASVSGFGILSLLNRSSYKSVYVPEFYEEVPVTAVSGYAFYSYSSITTVRLPATLEEIGESAFDGCKRLTDIYYGGTLENWNAVTFGENWDNGTTSYTVHCSDGTITIGH